MRYGGIFWGSLILLVGTALFIGNLLNVSVWSYLLPMILVFAGIWILFLSRTGSTPREQEDVSIPLEGANRAEVRIRHGAGRLILRGSAGNQVLASGSFSGGVTRRVQRRGETIDLEMRVPEDIWFRGGVPWIFGSWSPINWDMRLNGDIPMRIDLETGAGEYRVDLSEVKAEDIQWKTGASSSELTLPANAGRTRVKVSSGAAAVLLRVPEGVAANIKIQSGLAGVKVDERRFPRSGNGYTSPDYTSATNAAEIEVETGVGAIEIR